jgi:hypothetical protein
VSIRVRDGELYFRRHPVEAEQSALIIGFDSKAFANETCAEYKRFGHIQAAAAVSISIDQIVDLEMHLVSISESEGFVTSVWKTAFEKYPSGDVSTERGVIITAVGINNVNAGISARADSNRLSAAFHKIRPITKAKTSGSAARGFGAPRTLRSAYRKALGRTPILAIA